MDEIKSVLIILVLAFKDGNGLSLTNTQCPSMCVCNGDKATCSGHGSHLQYIPPLPENTTSLDFTHNCLKSLSWEEDAFKNISGLYLTRLDLKSNRINHINRLAFRMLPHLQYLDLSENKGLHSVTKSFQGLENNTLREIRLTT